MVIIDVVASQVGSMLKAIKGTHPPACKGQPPDVIAAACILWPRLVDEENAHTGWEELDHAELQRVRHQVREAPRVHSAQQTPRT